MEENIYKLKESEEKYRNLFENVHDGIIYLDKWGKIIDVNPKALQIFGGSKKELLGKHFTKIGLFSLMDIPKLTSNFVDIIRGKTVTTNVNFKNKYGRMIFLECSSSFIRKDKKIVDIIVIAREITERKKAEEELKTSEARYRSYIEATKQLGWTTDAKGLVIEDIPTWRAYTGQSFEKIKNWGWFKAIHPDDAKRTAEVWEKAIKTKSIYETEYRVRGKDGKYKWFLARGIPVLKEDGSIREWVGTCIDISERIKIEEEIKSGQEKWSSLMQNTNDIIMIVDDKNMIQYINKTIPPYTSEETIGKTVYEYVPREQQDIMRNSLRKVFRIGKPDSYEISSNIPKIGIVWFTTKVVPIKRDGMIVSVIMISTDITERKRSEEELKKARDNLQSKVEELERFNRLAVGRELKMIELKNRIKELEKSNKT